MDAVTLALIKAIAGGGSVGGGLLVTNNAGTLDKTWQQIYDAAAAGLSVCLLYASNDIRPLQQAYYDSRNSVYAVMFAQALFSSSTANGYPEM